MEKHHNVLDLILIDVCLDTGAADGAAGTRLECRGCSASFTNVLRSRLEHSHLYLHVFILTCMCSFMYSFSILNCIQLSIFFIDGSSFSSPESEEKKSSKSKSKDKSSGDHRNSKCHKDHGDSKSNRDYKGSKHHRNISESDGDSTDATRDSEDTDSEDSDGAKNRNSTSTLNTWLKKSSESLSSSSFVKKTTTSSSLKPSSSSSSSSAAQMLSRFASGTSIAKKEAAERKRKARASDEHVSSEGENDNEEETVSDSEFEDSDDELDSTGDMTEMKKEILTFFQEATIDELSLISGCSIKKAQKIVELRPYDTWQSLVRECVCVFLLFF